MDQEHDSSVVTLLALTLRQGLSCRFRVDRSRASPQIRLKIVGGARDFGWSSSIGAEPLEDALERVAVMAINRLYPLQSQLPAAGLVKKLHNYRELRGASPPIG
jgi:hypothetical protein